MAIMKRDDTVPELRTHSGSAASETHTILGKESRFEGKLTFEGVVRIDGHFKGEVVTKGTLIVGQSAHLEAEIDVGQIIINGEVIGNVTARESVEIHAPGRLRGNITTPTLVIDKGVIFEGSCQMGDQRQGTGKVHNLGQAKAEEK